MGQALLTKPPASESEFAASLPWEGLLSLAGQWAGAGSLFDWLAPGDWQIDRDWSARVVIARMTDAVLLYIQQVYVRHLPRHAGEWLDAISPQVLRLVRYSDVPTAHTDWAATLSVFGRYPSEAYVERKSIQTVDSPFTRVLNWTARTILSSDKVVLSAFGRTSLTSDVRARFGSALELSEVSGATQQARPSEIDLDACRAAGGIWLVLARIADLLAGLRSGSAKAQLLALRPILPTFAHQLFELGVLGLLATTVRQTISDSAWHSVAPLGAAQSGVPSLRMQSKSTSWSAYYQTVPSNYRSAEAGYHVLSRELGGGSLRPDIWIMQERAGQQVEIVFECKYSVEATYVATGIPQCFAYSVEFPAPPSVQRLYVVVGPEEVVARTRLWNRRFAVTNPSGAMELVRQSLTMGDSFLEGEGVAT